MKRIPVFPKKHFCKVKILALYFVDVVNDYKTMKFNQKEVALIIALIEGKRAGDDLLRGLRGKNNAEKERDEFYDELIKKVLVLPVKEINFK